MTIVPEEISDVVVWSTGNVRMQEREVKWNIVLIISNDFQPGKFDEGCADIFVTNARDVLIDLKKNTK